MSFFSILIASDSNLNSPELFDGFRDEMRDGLTADSPAAFPRFGARMTSVSAILEYFFPSCEREMLCLGPGGAHRVPNELLLCLCIPVNVAGSNQPTATTLQCWLDDWIQSLSNRLCARSLHDPSVQQSRLVLLHTPLSFSLKCLWNQRTHSPPNCAWRSRVSRARVFTPLRALYTLIINIFQRACSLTCRYGITMDNRIKAGLNELSVVPSLMQRCDLISLKARPPTYTYITCAK